MIAGSVSIKAGGSGKIDLGDSITGYGKVSLETTDGVIMEGAGKRITTPSLTMTSVTGSLGSSILPLGLNVNNLQAVTGTGGGTSGIFLDQTGPIVLQKIASNGNFELSVSKAFADKNAISTEKNPIVSPTVRLSSSFGNIDVATQTHTLSTSSPKGSTTVSNKGQLSIEISNARDTYTLNQVNGEGQFDQSTVSLNGSITAGQINITITPTLARVGGIFVGTPGAVLIANGVVIDNQSRSDIGTAMQPLYMSAGGISLRTKGSVYASNEGSTTISNSSAGPGVMTDPVVFSFNTVPDFKGNGGITIGAGGIKASSQATSTILLNSSENGAGEGGIAYGGGELKAQKIILSDGAAGAGTKSIGFDAYNPIKVNSLELSVNTQGNAYLSNSGTANLNVLDSTLSSSSTFYLTSKGSIDTSSGFGSISAKAIVLVAPAGKSIGIDAANPAKTNANILILRAGTSVFANTNAIESVTLESFLETGTRIESDASETFSLTAPNASDLDLQSPNLTAANLTFKSGGSLAVINNPLVATKSIFLEGLNQLELTAAIKAPNITLSTGSGGIILQTVSAPIDASKSLSILIDNGGTVDLGKASNSAAALSTNVTGSASITLLQAKPMQLDSIVGANQKLTIQYTGKITSTAKSVFTAKDVTLVPSGLAASNSIGLKAHFTANGTAILTANGGGDISLGGILGTGDRTLTTSGKGGDIFLNGDIVGDKLTLSTEGGNISNTAVAHVNATTELNIVLNGAGTANLSKAAGDISVLNTKVVGAGVVNVSSNSQKGLTLNTIDGPLQTLIVSASDSILAANLIPVKTLNVTAGGAGGIGSKAQPIPTSATTLSLIDSVIGANVFAKGTNTAGLTLTGASAGGTLDVVSAGAITVNSVANGNTISLQSGGNGGIIINNNIGNANGNITLKAEGTGNITTKSATTIVSGQSVSIISNGGSISGAAAKTALKTSSDSLTLNTTGKGIVFVDNKTADPVTLNNSSAGNSFTFVSTGPLTINSVSTNADLTASTGSIDITTKTGALTISPSAKLIASGGNVRLQNDDIPNGSITIGAGSTISASSTVPNVGNVTINLGVKLDIASRQIPDANVIENKTGSGKIFYGKNGITALPPNNTLNALDRNIYFDTDDMASNSITLGGGVTITADPPAGFEGFAILPSTPARAASPVNGASNVLIPTANSLGKTRASIAQPAVTRNYETSLLNFASNISAGVQSLASMVKPVTAMLQGSVKTFETTGTVQAGSTQTRAVQAAQLTVTEAAAINAASHAKSIKSIHEGQVFFAPLVDTIIETTLGKVSIAAGSLALLCASPQRLSVYNFDDLHRDAVQIQVANKAIVLSPGRHVTVSRIEYRVENCSSNRFEHLNSTHAIAHRSMLYAELGDGLRLVKSEFSIPSAISALKELRDLIASKQCGDIRAKKHMLKTIASLQLLKPGSERFRKQTISDASEQFAKSN